MARRSATAVGSVRRWLVLRLSWEVDSYLGVWCHRDEEDGGIPVAMFCDFKLAKQRCQELEREARLEFSPFLFLSSYDGLSSLSTRNEEQWRQSIEALGLVMPDAKRYPLEKQSWMRDSMIDWSRWWHDQIEQLDPQKRLAIWELCDKINLYSVAVVLE
jgi:hypothetical protein